ncbi:MAG: hypothetical protein AAF593_15900 [Planctomycetota bacterium]
MVWLYFCVGLLLGGTLVTLAWLIEVRPNLAFLRGAKSYRCVLRSARVTEDRDGEGTYRSEFQIELLDADSPEPRKRMATYAAHGEQDRKSGSWYGHGRAKREVMQFELGQEYSCWVLDKPNITSMTRKTLWWISWSFGLFGAILLLFCVLTSLGLIKATFTPMP